MGVYQWMPALIPFCLSWLSFCGVEDVRRSVFWMARLQRTSELLLPIPLFRDGRFLSEHNIEDKREKEFVQDQKKRMRIYGRLRIGVVT